MVRRSPRRTGPFSVEAELAVCDEGLQLALHWTDLLTTDLHRIRRSGDGSNGVNKGHRHAQSCSYGP